MLGYLVKYPPGLSNVAMENRLKRRFRSLGISSNWMGDFPARHVSSAEGFFLEVQ